jgi:O-glycosyl hydrolase
MQRIQVESQNKEILTSAYKDKNQVVLVMVNNANNQSVEIPNIWKKQRTRAYVTSSEDNLKSKKANGKGFVLPKESITTLVISKP